jgi:hypothetical protein
MHRYSNSSQIRPSWLRAIGRAGILAVAVSWCIQSATATPIPNPGRLGNKRWPKGSHIQIWVPDDPKAADFPGRRDALIQGLETWFTPGTQPGRNDVAGILAGQEITASVTATEPTSGPRIVVQWVAPADGQDAETTPYPPTSNDIDSAVIQVDPNKSMDEEDAYKLGAHEAGHALGLDHPAGGNVDSNVMNSPVPGGGPSNLDYDVDEFKSVYLATADTANDNVVAQVTPQPGGFLYQYTAAWVSGAPLSVFQVETNGAPVFDIEAPQGWMVDNRPVPADVLLDTEGNLVPFVGFVHADEQHYLDQANPILTFQFRSTGAPGPTQGFLNGSFETTGPTVPEPAPVGLVAIGCVLAVFARRGLRRVQAH